MQLGRRSCIKFQHHKLCARWIVIPEHQGVPFPIFKDIQGYSRSKSDTLPVLPEMQLALRLSRHKRHKFRDPRVPTRNSPSAPVTGGAHRGTLEPLQCARHTDTGCSTTYLCPIAIGGLPLRSCVVGRSWGCPYPCGKFGKVGNVDRILQVLMLQSSIDHC